MELTGKWCLSAVCHHHGCLKFATQLTRSTLTDTQKAQSPFQCQMMTNSVTLLIFEIIKNACELQYEWFDFNPSGGKEGVKAFKRSFGTLELSCPMILKNSLTNSILNKFKSS
jgi:hypothetical protein